MTYDAEGILNRLLGPLERAVMEFVWSQDQATVRDVHDALSRDRKIAYTTVLTVMFRLTQKSLLERETRTTQHVYRASLSAQEFVEQATRREVERLLTQYGDLAITHFLQAASAVDPDLKERLRHLAASAAPNAAEQTKIRRRRRR